VNVYHERNVTKVHIRYANANGTNGGSEASVGAGKNGRKRWALLSRNKKLKKKKNLAIPTLLDCLFVLPSISTN